MTARHKAGIALLLIIGGLSWAAWADFAGQVVGVTDGDTIEVLNGYTPIKVRLNGIDCPEKKQAFGTRAKQYASDLAFGKTVTVREAGPDRYGRTPGEVILSDGRSLNRELVRAGLAWWYRQYAPKDSELEALEKAAQQTKAGLWFDADPVPPWEWRKKRKKAKEQGTSASATVPSSGARDSRSTYAIPSFPSYPPHVAENSDIRGADNDGDGRVEPVHVRGYYRKNGTYVRGHYRASPRR